jgi:tRNA (cytidine/uridine-2'-O-)-methyltransferase
MLASMLMSRAQSLLRYTAAARLDPLAIAIAMFNVVLVEPEIPPNTGNIIRLCANAGCQLHLVEPLGFVLNNARMRRAGLDYHEFAAMQVHASWDALIAAHEPDPARLFALTTRARVHYDRVSFNAGDWLVFGSETRGLSDAMRARFPDHQRLRVPLRPDNRSLNLSNTVAIVVFEAWRQHGFAGGS